MNQAKRIIGGKGPKARIPSCGLSAFAGMMDLPLPCLIMNLSPGMGVKSRTAFSVCGCKNRQERMVHQSDFFQY